MKKLILLALFAYATSSTTIAQIELKINPIGLLFNSPDLSAEYIVNEDIGVEFGLGLEYGTQALTDYDRSGFNVFVAGKYYFSPDDGADKFYAGAYLRPRSRKITDNDDDGFDFGYKQSAFAAGVLIGYKWVGARGILFELALGGGRAFGDKFTWNDGDNSGEADGFGVDFLGRLAVGYRFGGDK
ncbi:MAG: DUF3575 domain-containing protein [Saprospiraceae bacterium]